MTGEPVHHLLHRGSALSDEGLAPPLRKAVEATAARVRIHGIGAEDAAGVLGPASAALVRPDGHIAAVGPADDPRSITDYLERWTLPSGA